MLFTALSMAALAQDTAVVQVEYFFDSDYGVGNNTLVNVTPAADGTFPFTAKIAGLSLGYHKLYVRTKDSNGKWSFTARRNVEVFTPDSKVSLVSGEYFIDSDTGFGAGSPIIVSAPDSVILQNFTAAISGLSVGYHKLYGRLKDNLGRWSQTFRRNIEVYKNDTNYITKVEYFFKTDNGYGACSTVLLSPPATDISYSFSIPLSDIPMGADTLFVRVQDSSENKWSLTALKDTKDTSTVLPVTLLNFTVVKQDAEAQLSWQTANEINTAYFNVQRSMDGRNFTTVGKLMAKGSSKINNDYAFADDVSQLMAGNIYYRLQMADKDEKITYSSIKVINISSTLRIVVIPNPVVNYNANFNIYSPVNVKLQLAIYNELGNTIYNEQFDMPAGSLNKTINLSSVAAGNYFVSISNGTSIQTAKFIKQ